MTIYLWSERTDGEVIEGFLPASDVLHFDDAGISAGAAPSPSQQIDFFADSSPPISYFSFGGVEVALNNVDPRALSSTNVTFASGGLFKYGDDLVGTANDDLGNTIDGGAFGDWLIGAGGNDSVNGGGGNDMLVVIGAGQLGTGAYGNDTLNGGAGVDHVFYDGATLAINLNLTTGIATGGRAGANTMTLIDVEWATAGAGNDTMIGNGMANEFYGQAGNDSLSGGGGNDTFVGGAGTDTLVGGGGNDSYYINSTADVLTEVANAGTDIVYSPVTKTLALNFENLTLLGAGNLSGTGNTGNNVITGNGGNNVLNGDAGNDSLLGLAGNDTIVGGAGDDTLDGGEGDDSMTGGAGSDTYYVIEAGDVAVEAVNGGLDTVITDRSIVMPDNVENLVWLNTGGGGGFCQGNALDNVMRTTSGAGSLTMDGGDGSDTVSLLGVLSDVFVNLDAGNASFISSLVSMENATGGAGNDTLTGDAGGNRLNGAGGGDSMVGGAGDDTYYVNDELDLVVETSNTPVGLLLGGGGSGTGLLGVGGITDTVVAAINFSLAALEFVENITLTGAATLATGNALANVLTGGAGNDSLVGAGGNDTLDGGAGNDTLKGDGGNDVMVWSSTDLFRGGTGTDTLRVTGAGVTLDLRSVVNTKIIDVEVINIAGSGNNRLKLALSDVLDISSTTNTLRVDGNAGDVVHRGTGWATGADQVIGANTYHRYTQGGTTLLVDSDITGTTVY